jgi:anaerobic selenocysteine-containing dehydrogenase
MSTPGHDAGQALQPGVYMHPDAMSALGLQTGDLVTVASPHDSIPSVLEADDSLAVDVIAMHHAFGGLPGEDREVRDRGSNVGRLVPTDVDYDPITGMPPGKHPGAGDGRHCRLNQIASIRL